MSKERAAAKLILSNSQLNNFSGSAYQSRRSENTNPKNKGGESSKNRNSNTMSPLGNNEKAKKLFPQRLHQMIEDNIRLKCQNQDLKVTNQRYLDVLGDAEKTNKYKGNLAANANNELGFHHSKFEIMRRDILNLTGREQFQHKNLRGLINYAKKLTQELEEYKVKVKMAEKIIQDLRNTGNESLDSLINMLESYQQKQLQTQQEIQKLKQLVLLKDDEILQLDEDIGELSCFVSTAKDKLEDKIDDLLRTLEDNRRLIRRQDKIIVDLQQKNEVSQINIAQAAEETQRKTHEKNKLQLKLKELEDQKSNLQESIVNIESKLVTFRTAVQSQSSQPQPNYTQDTQQHHGIQWKDAAVVLGEDKKIRGDFKMDTDKSTTKSAQDGGHLPQGHQPDEKFDEVLADELRLDEWTIWEHYESMIQQRDAKKQYLESFKKIAWFNDVISYWQVWNTLPLSNLKNFFYNGRDNTVPTYDIKGDIKRISTLSMFRKGIEPQWEDKQNTKGGEYKMRLFLNNIQEPTLEFLNKIWESLVQDLLAARFPHPELIVGVRIVDKSFAMKENFRIEVWTRYDVDAGEMANANRDFIDKEYNAKYNMNQGITFNNHAS
eukprot:403334433